MGRRENGGNPINGLIAAFIGLLVIVAVIILAPVLAGSLQAATPNIGTCSYTGNASVVYTGTCGEQNTTDTYRTAIYNVPYDDAARWNPDYNTDLPSGSDIWTQNVTIGAIVILVFFVSMAILYIRVIA